MNQDPTVIVCSATGVTATARTGVDGAAKLPRGWRRVGQKLFSPKGWNRCYSTRTHSIPIAAVTIEGAAEGHADRRAFVQALTAAHRAATEYANACWVWLVAHDVAPTVRQEQKVVLPRIDPEIRNAWLRELYGMGAAWPAMETATRTAVRNSVWSDYQRARFDLRVRFSIVRQGYRYPFPLPFPADAGKVKFAVDPGNGWISLRLRLGGEAYWVRLSGSKRYRHALMVLRRVGQDVALGSVTLLPRRVFSADSHRATDVGVGDRAFQRHTRWQTMASVAVHIPIEKDGEASDKTLMVRSGAEFLMQGVESEHQRTWTLRLEEARRLVAYAERLKRLADDRIAERASSRSRSAALRRRTRDVVERHRRWRHDLLHKVSRSVVNWARLRRCASLRLDLAERFSDHFPWAKLRTLIEQKCHESGIAFAEAGDVALREDPVDVGLDLSMLPSGQPRPENG